MELASADGLVRSCHRGAQLICTVSDERRRRVSRPPPIERDHQGRERLIAAMLCLWKF